MSDTLTIDKIREAMRSVGGPLPDFIVSVYALPGKPIEWQGHVFLTPEDARMLHAESPLILTQILGPTSARYRLASPFNEPFPVDLRLPPFNTATGDAIDSEHPR